MTRVFGHVTVVREVSLRVGPGEIVGLLGANGAGKTTLIRMLLSLLPVTGGTIALFGEPPSRESRRRIGYVPQGLGLYDDLTVAENMSFSAAVFGGSAGEGVPARRRRHASVAPGGGSPRGVLGDEAAGGEVSGDCVVGGGGFGSAVSIASVPAGRLPLGRQRRAAFAQALAHHPDLLILDEPTSGVYPLGRARLWDTVHSAAEAGAGALVTTHHMDEGYLTGDVQPDPGHERPDDPARRGINAKNICMLE